MRIHHPTPRRAFTLIELLVVISIIALLIAILLPVLSQAQKEAKASQCLSNQRQMGIAMAGYVSDNSFVFPQPAGDNDIDPTSLRNSAIWFNAVDYYVSQKKKSYSAAADRNYNPYKQDPVYETFGENTAVTGGNGSRTFKMNHHFGDIDSPQVTAERYRWTAETEIKKTSKTVLLFDGTARDIGTPTFALTSSYVTDFHGAERKIGLRHSDAANVLFVDGHAAREKQDTQWRTVGSVVFKHWFFEPDPRQTLTWDFRTY